MIHKPGIDVKLIVPQTIMIVSEESPAKFGQLPGEIMFAAVSMEFEGWVSPREYISAETWFTEGEVYRFNKFMQTVAKKRIKTLQTGGIEDESGIFNLVYNVWS